MVCKKMNMELSTALHEIGLKAQKASSILNTVTSEQKNKFFDFAIEAIQEMPVPFLMLTKLILRQQKIMGRMKLLSID